MPKQHLSIGEVARRAGLRPSALRYYERVGLLPVAERVSGRRRLDPEEVLPRLALIDLAKRAGFTLAEIRTLLHGFSRGTPASERWRALTGPKLAEVEERIARAQRTRRLLERLQGCECASFEVCAPAGPGVR